MNKNIKYLNNEKGQALLFVVVALTVAMAIGMSVSTRTISSVRRSTSTDTSSRVYSAAEGGVEFFLNQPTNVLDSLSDGNNNGGSECPTGTSAHETNAGACVITYTSATGDNITSRATVSVAPFTYNNPAGSPADHYWFYVNTGEVKEVNLGSTYNGNLRVCWNSQDSAITPDIYYQYYNSNGVLRKGILRNVTATNAAYEGTVPASLVTAATASPYPTLDYTNCATVAIPNNNVRGIRFKALYAPAKMGIFILSGVASFPTQGYTINSIGELFENEAIRTVKRLRVFRSFQYMPSVFDYAIYSDTDLVMTP